MTGMRKRLEKSSREFLYGSKLFFPLRSSYQYLFKRDKLLARQQMRQFYSSFINSGDLVFDIGANFGSYSEIFCDLGAQVVAVEPNPYCCQDLCRLARARPVHVESCAAGDVPGKTTFYPCEESGISTVVYEYQEATRRSPLHQDSKWLGALEVDVLTLDQLAARYGIPVFVKVDVEGYDDHVLRGMSFHPAALSFEFNRQVPEVALRCLAAPVFAENQYEFNFVRGLEMCLGSESWMSADEIGDLLQALVREEDYGDIIARLASSHTNAQQSWRRK